MITADQITCHLVGDYVLQSDWMANQKTKSTVAASFHAVCYSLPFLFLRPSLAAWAVIVGTHLLIDRFRLARYLVWAKNWLSPKVAWKFSRDNQWSSASNEDWELWRKWIDHGTEEVPLSFKNIITMRRARMLSFSVCAGTGYPPDRPAWLAVWLLILADNIVHILVNGAALRWL